MIQVDMFEVQLGASILLQFKTKEGKVIRVLADGGVGHGLPVGHVHQKLAAVLRSFPEQDRRIDLVIGTHYDADHLDGLVPIIEDESIAISEAWLPPVANDSEPHYFDGSPRDSDFLAKEFYGDADHRKLFGYLRWKREVCERLRLREGDNPYRPFDWAENIDGYLELFRTYQEEAMRSIEPATEERFTHADDEPLVPMKLEDIRKAAHSDFHPYWWRYKEWLYDEPEKILGGIAKESAITSAGVRNLAAIRKSAARDAITAISLAKVVDALYARGVPILCQTIPDGIPRRFVWRTASRRFEGGSHLAAQGPVLTLLGPSEGLVRKHWNRLPIGTYAGLAALALIPIKSITPSNQLSYVARFEAEKQAILVAGDAGCVDFQVKRGSRRYHQKLLDALLPLHVVQVAHHAGNNAHFYRVLSAVGYPKGVSKSFLLVSHATRDKHRPSREFIQFCQELRHDPEVATILFTCQPSADKARELKSMVHSVVGAATAKGDVCLRFEQGAFQRGSWKVVKHAVAV